MATEGSVSVAGQERDMAEGKNAPHAEGSAEDTDNNPSLPEDSVRTDQTHQDDNGEQSDNGQEGKAPTKPQDEDTAVDIAQSETGQEGKTPTRPQDEDNKVDNELEGMASQNMHSGPETKEVQQSDEEKTEQPTAEEKDEMGDRKQGGPADQGNVDRDAVTLHQTGVQKDEQNVTAELGETPQDEDESLARDDEKNTSESIQDDTAVPQGGNNETEGKLGSCGDDQNDGLAREDDETPDGEILNGEGKQNQTKDQTEVECAGQAKEEEKETGTDVPSQVHEPSVEADDEEKLNVDKITDQDICSSTTKNEEGNPQLKEQEEASQGFTDWDKTLSKDGAEASKIRSELVYENAEENIDVSKDREKTSVDEGSKTTTEAQNEQQNVLDRVHSVQHTREETFKCRLEDAKKSKKTTQVDYKSHDVYVIGRQRPEEKQTTPGIPAPFGLVEKYPRKEEEPEIILEGTQDRLKEEYNQTIKAIKYRVVTAMESESKEAANANNGVGKTDEQGRSTEEISAQQNEGSEEQNTGRPDVDTSTGPRQRAIHRQDASVSEKKQTPSPSIRDQSQTKDNKLMTILSKALRIGAFCMIIGFIIFLLQPGKDNHTESNQKSSRYDILERRVTSLREQYPAMDNSLWDVIAGSAWEHLKDQPDPKTPVVLLLVGQPGKIDVNQVAIDTAEMFSRVFSPNSAEANVIHVIGTDHESLPADRAKSEMDKILKSGFRRHSHVALVENFDKIPPCSAILFHGYCDNDAAPFKDAVLIFTMTLENEIPEDATDKDAEKIVQDQLKHRWSQCPEEFPAAKIVALFSRVSNNVVIIK